MTMREFYVTSRTYEEASHFSHIIFLTTDLGGQLEKRFFFDEDVEARIVFHSRSKVTGFSGKLSRILLFSYNCSRGGINFYGINSNSRLGHSGIQEDVSRMNRRLERSLYRCSLPSLDRVNARLFAGRAVGDWVGEHILTLRPSSDRCYLTEWKAKEVAQDCRLGRLQRLYQSEWKPGV